MNKTCLLALLATTAPFAVQAESITGGLTLSYSQHSVDGVSQDLDTVGLDGRLNLEMDNGFTFGVDLGHSTSSVDGIPIDVTGEFISLDAGYRFGGGFKAGVFVDRLTLGVDLPPSLEITLKTNGVTLGYEGNGFEGEIFAGESSLSLPIIPVDIRNYGITGHYTGVEKLDVGAAFLRARVSSGPMSEDLDFVGLAATYMINDSLMVFGGMSQLDVASFDGLDTFGLGLSYDLGAQMGFASSVSIEYAQTDLAGFVDVDAIRVGLTIPLGKKGAVLPMNSVADSVLNARRGALNAALTSMF